MTGLYPRSSDEAMDILLNDAAQAIDEYIRKYAAAGEEDLTDEQNDVLWKRHMEPRLSAVMEKMKATLARLVAERHGPSSPEGMAAFDEMRVDMATAAGEACREYFEGKN